MTGLCGSPIVRGDMSRPSLHIALGWVCLILLASPVHADEPLQLAPRPGLLLLNNGEVLAGKISRSGDRYSVALPHGELRVAHADVEMVCDDLDEAYRRKRAAFERGHVGRHVELGNWCLKHELIGYAATELAEALAANPRHPDIPALRRRLELALEPPPDVVEASPTFHHEPTRPNFEKVMRALPDAALESFKQTVQPVLLNHCATAGCHGPRSDTALAMLRIPPGRTASLKLTQRNLHSVLELTDQDSPAASRLLKAAIAPHGGSPTAVFNGPTDQQYRRLHDWVTQLSAQRPAGNQAEHVDRGNLALHQNGRQPPAGAEALAKDGAPSPSPETTAVDPFDPEIFNRRFFPGRDR